MATQSYKVQKGDTLGAISKKLGVDMGSITGYKSGDANKIYEGETLSYGAPAAKESSYVSEVKSQLGGEPAKTTDPYGLESIRTNIADVTTKRDAAFAELKDISTKTFNSEYEKKGLAEKKTKMSMLDSEIAEAKRVRDEAINKVRTNPGLSAAQMTGDVNKLAGFQNDIINAKIAERNAVAGEYNSGLEEIDRQVQNVVKDKTLDYGYYDSTLKDLNSRVSDYTKTYREDLQNETKNSQFERELAQALTIARMKANNSGGGNPPNLQLKTDPNTGEPLYWFNPDTGAITYLNQDTQAPAAGGGVSFDTLDTASQPAQASVSKWYNPLSWFK